MKNLLMILFTLACYIFDAHAEPPFCSGTAQACGSFSGAGGGPRCLSQNGCAWDDFDGDGTGTCIGRAKSCDSFSTSSCKDQFGCYVYTPIPLTPVSFEAQSWDFFYNPPKISLPPKKTVLLGERVLLSWPSNPYATHYIITQPNGTELTRQAMPSSSTVSSSYTTEALGTQSFSVRACNSAGCSAPAQAQVQAQNMVAEKSSERIWERGCGRDTFYTRTLRPSWHSYGPHPKLVSAYVYGGEKCSSTRQANCYKDFLVDLEKESVTITTSMCTTSIQYGLSNGVDMDHSYMIIEYLDD